MTDGAGAFKKPPYYGRDTVGPEIPAKYLTTSRDEPRIRYGAAAIQRQLEVAGFIEESSYSGKFGPITVDAIKRFQKHQGLYVDGKAGPKTCRLLAWRPIWSHQIYGEIVIPNNILYGLMYLESMLDPGAEGADTSKSIDRGIAQISKESFPDITDAQAYGDIGFSVAFSARNMRSAKHPDQSKTYAEMGRWDLAIAHHNSPALARRWFETGVAPYVETRKVQIADYVRHVQSSAKTAPADPPR
jgi:peptidoglycan hydrolase-like protein with peptidoglycan-binding domain